jgi:hypothetical protein
MPLNPVPQPVLRIWVSYDRHITSGRNWTVYCPRCTEIPGFEFMQFYRWCDAIDWAIRHTRTASTHHSLSLTVGKGR